MFLFIYEENRQMSEKNSETVHNIVFFESKIESLTKN